MIDPKDDKLTGVEVALLTFLAVFMVLAGYTAGLYHGSDTPIIPPGTPVVIRTPAPTLTPTPAPAWDGRLTALRVTVQPPPERRYCLTAAWISENGTNWPAWANDMMNFPEAGADHHVFGIVYDRAGNVVHGKSFYLAWADGADGRQAEPNGWANFSIYAKYDPRETAGPYRFAPFYGDELVGVGLPFGWHTSFFGVWRECDPSAVLPAESVLFSQLRE